MAKLRPIFEDRGDMRYSFDSQSNQRQGLASRVSQIPAAPPAATANPAGDFDLPTPATPTGGDSLFSAAIDRQTKASQQRFFDIFSDRLSRGASRQIKTADQWNQFVQGIPYNRANNIEPFIAEVTERYAPEGVKRELAARKQTAGEEAILRETVQRNQRILKEAGRDGDLQINPLTGQAEPKTPDFSRMGNAAFQALPMPQKMAVWNSRIKTYEDATNGKYNRTEIDREYGLDTVAPVAPVEPGTGTMTSGGRTVTAGTQQRPSSMTFGGRTLVMIEGQQIEPPPEVAPVLQQKVDELQALGTPAAKQMLQQLRQKFSTPAAAAPAAPAARPAEPARRVPLLLDDINERIQKSSRRSRVKA